MCAALERDGEEYTILIVRWVLWPLNRGPGQPHDFRERDTDVFGMEKQESGWQKWFRRELGVSRAAVLVYDIEPTLPNSRTNTPQDIIVQDDGNPAAQSSAVLNIN